MGTMARAAAAAATVALVAVSGVAAIAAGDGKGEGGAAQSRGRAPAISGGHDGKTAWMMADYKQLQLRKRSNPVTKTVAIELRSGRDVVSITVVDGQVSVGRGRRKVAVDSPAAFESLQQLLGGSTAVFAAKTMLSELESSSELQTPEMSLLASAAFVASMVGDVEAPRRLTDRFMAKHRGLYRQVMRSQGSCYWAYTHEVSDAWNQLQNCMDETHDDGFFVGAYRRLGCNGLWVMRSESAWFEYLKCLSPLTSISR